MGITSTHLICVGLMGKYLNLYRFDVYFDVSFQLSENAINILHGVVQMVQTGDYANALATLMSLASGPDFSTVASFLPSLKIMIQTASNSQIYLR